MPECQLLTCRGSISNRGELLETTLHWPYRHLQETPQDDPKRVMLLAQIKIFERSRVKLPGLAIGRGARWRMPVNTLYSNQAGTIEHTLHRADPNEPEIESRWQTTQPSGATTVREGKSRRSISLTLHPHSMTINETQGSGLQAVPTQVKLAPLTQHHQTWFASVSRKKMIPLEEIVDIAMHYHIRPGDYQRSTGVGEPPRIVREATSFIVRVSTLPKVKNLQTIASIVVCGDAKRRWFSASSSDPPDNAHKHFQPGILDQVIHEIPPYDVPCSVTMVAVNDTHIHR